MSIEMLWMISGVSERHQNELWKMWKKWLGENENRWPMADHWFGSLKHPHMNQTKHKLNINHQIVLKHQLILCNYETSWILTLPKYYLSQILTTIDCAREQLRLESRSKWLVDLNYIKYWFARSHDVYFDRFPLWRSRFKKIDSSTGPPNCATCVALVTCGANAWSVQCKNFKKEFNMFSVGLMFRILDLDLKNVAFVNSNCNIEII